MKIRYMLGVGAALAVMVLASVASAAFHAPPGLDVTLDIMNTDNGGAMPADSKYLPVDDFDDLHAIRISAILRADPPDEPSGGDDGGGNDGGPAPAGGESSDFLGFHLKGVRLFTGAGIV